MTKMRYLLNHLFGVRFPIRILLRKVPKSSTMLLIKKAYHIISITAIHVAILAIAAGLIAAYALHERATIKQMEVQAFQKAIDCNNIDFSIVCNFLSYPNSRGMQIFDLKECVNADYTRL